MDGSGAGVGASVAGALVGVGVGGIGVGEGPSVGASHGTREPGSRHAAVSKRLEFRYKG